MLRKSKAKRALNRKSSYNAVHATSSEAATLVNYFIVVFCLVAVAGIAVGLLYMVDFESSQTIRVNHLKTACTQETSRIVNMFEQHVQNTKTLTKLFLNDTNEEVNREQYASIIESLIETPGVTAFSYMKRIPHSERARVEAETGAYYRKRFANNPLFRDYVWEIKEPKNGMLVRRSNESEYLYVDYIEPAEENAGAIMFDVFSSPSREATFKRARATMEPQMTPRIKLVTNEEYGVLVVLAIDPPSPHFQISVFNIASVLSKTRQDDCDCGSTIAVLLEDETDANELLRAQNINTTNHDVPMTIDEIFGFKAWMEPTNIEGSTVKYLGAISSNDTYLPEDDLYGKEYQDTISMAMRTRFSVGSRDLRLTCIAGNDFAPSLLRIGPIVVVSVLGVILLIVAMQHQKSRDRTALQIQETRNHTQRMVISYMCHELRNPLHIIAYLVDEALSAGNDSSHQVTLHTAANGEDNTMNHHDTSSSSTQNQDSNLNTAPQQNDSSNTTPNQANHLETTKERNDSLTSTPNEESNFGTTQHRNDSLSSTVPNHEQLDSLQLLRSLTRNMQSLVNGFVDYGALMNEEAEIVCSPLDVIEQTNDICCQAKVLTPKSLDWDISYSTMLQELLKTHLVHTSQPRLAQAVLNGLTSAIKHTTTGQIKITVEVGLVGEENTQNRVEGDSWYSQGALAIVSKALPVASNTNVDMFTVGDLVKAGRALFTWTIVDTGEGIASPKKISKITKLRRKPSYHLDSGLGIRVSSVFVQRMGGILRLGNRNDGVSGCVFKLSLPCELIEREYSDIDTTRLSSVYEGNVQINVQNSDSLKKEVHFADSIIDEPAVLSPAEKQDHGVSPTNESNGAGEKQNHGVSPTNESSGASHQVQQTSEVQEIQARQHPKKSISAPLSFNRNQETTSKQVSRNGNGNIRESSTEAKNREDTVVNGKYSNLRIVVCDDEALNRKIFVQRLKRMGIPSQNIEIYCDGTEIVESLTERSPKRSDPDVVFLDIVMVKMDGVQACKLLRQANISSLLIAATGNGSAEDLVEYRECGFDETIVKPFGKDEVLKVLENAAKRRRRMKS